MINVWTQGKNTYSVDMMISYINHFKPKYQTFNVLQISHNLNSDSFLDKQTNQRYSAMDIMNNPDKYKDHMDKFRSPILKYSIILSSEYGVVDGTHRIIKAYMKKIKDMKYYLFDKTLMKKFIIDTSGNWENVRKIPMYDIINLYNERFKK